MDKKSALAMAIGQMVLQYLREKNRVAYIRIMGVSGALLILSIS
ncbi:hypothetical protein NON20_00130 [Synechocystis sp. B12]|nr:hypothetical protein NON20_00130 [Synechocystis sp. B12]